MKHSLEEKIVINRPFEEVYCYLKDVKAWPHYLPHVKNIDLLYDDGQYQEFYMDVLSENGELLKVRSIRRCIDSDSISFFQPTPPAFLKHHSGHWKFTAIAPNQCEVTTTHQWDLPDQPSQHLTPDHIHRLLSEHARLAITTWKNVLEQSH